MWAHLYQGVFPLGTNVSSLHLYQVGIRPGTNVPTFVPGRDLARYKCTSPMRSLYHTQHNICTISPRSHPLLSSIYFPSNLTHLLSLSQGRRRLAPSLGVQWRPEPREAWQCPGGRSSGGGGGAPWLWALLVWTSLGARVARVGGAEAGRDSWGTRT
jgi:hypothetical protein